MKYNKAKNRHDNGLPEKQTAHQAGRPYKPKPKPKVNRIWADTTIEASKSSPVSVAQLSRASDIFHIYPHHVSRAVCLTRPQGPTVPDADADNAAASLV